MKKTKKEPISKAIKEVWEWKDGVYEEIKKMSFDEKRNYYDKALKKAVKMLKWRLETNPDGSYSIVKQ
jgi:hypothetical protein